jgi:hypothetical protein
LNRIQDQRIKKAVVYDGVQEKIAQDRLQSRPFQTDAGRQWGGRCTTPAQARERGVFAAPTLVNRFGTFMPVYIDADKELLAGFVAGFNDGMQRLYADVEACGLSVPVFNAG